ncbi:MAG: RNA polymerase sigma factor [Planctomycetota bacterium]
MTTNPSQSADASGSSTEVLSPAQFAEQFEECYKRLWLLAAAMLSDRHLAEDVVQDAGIVALKQLEKFEKGTNFLAWMSQIVRLQAFNRSRKRTRRRTRSVDPVTLDTQTNETNEEIPIQVATTELPADQTMFDDEVMSALGELRDTARACLLLRTLHQLSYADIGAMLDIAEGTAMSHVHRSKALLRKRLAPSTSEPDKTIT